MTEQVDFHHVRFFRPAPHAIKCIAIDKSKTRLALSRSDCSIEIWDLRATAYLEKVFPKASDLSIESLAWLDDRLFSAGLDGHITEQCLVTLRKKSRLSVASCAAIWCMKVSKDGKHMAIGNEEGHVVLHCMHCGELTYVDKFQKQEGPVLCLDWHISGEKIVTGSMNEIRTWDVKTGITLNRIILGRVSKNEPTVVWCIHILSDMTIVSGDSCGNTSFWNGNNGTLLSHLSAAKAHKADILTLAVSEDEQEIYSSGIDPAITKHLKSETTGKWLRSGDKVAHSHDVRCLQYSDNTLYSGGDDCNLVITNLSTRKSTKYSAICQRSKNLTVVAKDVQSILLTCPKSLMVVKMHPEKPCHFTASLKMTPRNIEKVICSSISADGKWLAYSTVDNFCLYSIDFVNPSDTVPTIRKMPNFMPDSTSPVTAMLFNSKSTQLILQRDSKLFVVICNAVAPTIKTVLESEPDDFKEIDLLQLSPNDKFLACGDRSGNVTVYDLNTSKVHCTLPVHVHRSTALQFDSLSQNLFVAYSDRTIVEYSVKKMRYTSWSKSDYNRASLMQASHHPIISIVVCNSVVLFQDEGSIYCINMHKDAPCTKRIKLGQNASGKKPVPFTVQKYKNLCSISPCKNGVLAVTVPTEYMDSCLPPPMFKKKFGT